MSVASQIPYSKLARQGSLAYPMAGGARWFAWGVFWIFLGAILVGGTTYTIAMAFGVLIGGMTPIALMLLLVAGAILASGTRRVRDLALLYYLEQAVRINAPLAEMIFAAERNETGRVRARLRRLRLRIEGGDTIADALAIAAPSLPRRIILLVSAGENTGRLAQALRRVVERRDLFPAKDAANSIYRRWYPMIMLAFCLVVVQVVLVFVMPKFQQMLKDFHVTPPGSMVRLLAFDVDAGLALTTVYAAALLLFCGRMAGLIFTPRGVILGPLRPLVDRVAWYTPIVGGVARSRTLADACYIIAGGQRAGLTTAQAISQAASASVNAVMKRRLARWANRLNAGDSLSSAARKARLPALVREMLAATRTDDESREVFEFLSRHYDGRFSRAALLLRAAIIPATAIGFGIIVGSIALGVFEPLVGLINKLAGN